VNTNASLPLLSLILLLIVLPALSFAQSPDQLHNSISHESAKDSIKIGFLPALGYSSDVGFLAGGVFSRYHYQEGMQPFKNQLNGSALATTKGLFSVSLQYEQIETFGRPIRSRTMFGIGRIKESTYFGFGNNTPFDPSLWEQGYYYYETYFGLAELYGRKSIWRSETRNSHLDWVLVTNLSMENPQTDQVDNRLTSDQPNYMDGLWVWESGTGLVWENRDNEFAATRGNTARLEVRVAPGLVMNNGSWQVQFQASQYATRHVWIFPVTAALKLGWHQAGGDTPFWRLPQAGGEYSMRGYADGRFLGDASLYYTAELRTWLIQYPEIGLRIGGQLFADGGRVFASHEITRAFFNDHKRTYGLGGAMSVFTNDFIVRGDLGFSDEIARFYLGIGYTF
jgi:outer membrane protein assembly factor BamA